MAARQVNGERMTQHKDDLVQTDNRGLRRWRFPAKKQTFQEMPDGTVQVTADDGRVGLFQSNGKYISGDLTQASKQMIVWCSDPRLPPACDHRWNILPVDVSRPSGWPEDLEKVLEFQLGEAVTPRTASDDPRGA